jgi:glutamine cyclotransferase
MSLRLLHLVLWTAAAAALGLLLVLAVRMVPAREGRGVSSPAPRSPDPSPSSSAAPSSSPVPLYHYRVIKTYPHDRRCFTQGLVYEDGFVYEGTGLYGQSALYKRDLQTGRTVKTLRLPDKYFGEGITLFGDKLIQLTWQSRTGFVYTKDTFTPLREFKYRGEGWGLTHDGKRLILSDGTATLRFLDPNTFAETGRLEVRDQGRPVERLNELEYVADGSPVARLSWRGRPALASRGHPFAGLRAGSGLALLSQEIHITSKVQGQDALATKEQGRDALATAGAGPRIYANIWPTDQIVIIDPVTGRVTGRIDLSGLWTPPADEQGESVLNGIAYLPETRHLLVTGKLWPRMYEIELVPALPQNREPFVR